VRRFLGGKNADNDPKIIPGGPPYARRQTDGFKTREINVDTNEIALASVQVDDNEAGEWSITTYVRFPGRSRLLQLDPVLLVGRVRFGHGDWQTGEDCEFDWRQGQSLRVCGSAIEVGVRYSTIPRIGAPNARVGATITRGGSPSNGEVTKTLRQEELRQPPPNTNLPVVVEIPRRAQKARLVCRVPTDYGRFLVTFWQEATGTDPVQRWIPTTPTDELPIPFKATDVSVSVVAGVIDCDLQFILEL
jgi:hypothetical protein